MLRNLVCAIVVDGLNNFRVGGNIALQYPGASPDPDAYTVGICATEDAHTVSSGLVLSVVCDAPLTTSVVIIQSLDTSAEKLCIAEVSIEIYGQYMQYATLFILIMLQ